MKFVKEVLLIMTFTFIGELLHAFLPLPVPAGVYGLLLLLLALMSGVVKLADVETSGNFLLDVMTMMFIPAGVAIMDSFSVLQPVIGPYLAVILVSTVLVLALTGLCAQKVLSFTETSESKAAEAAEEMPEFTTGIGREGEKSE
ncbi:MAG: CidA/LrgA family protein [Eubacteriales bacterium]|nr:CidA/LrgA family protein [Eubacteriales bacterium]